MNPQRTVDRLQRWMGGPFARRADRPQPSPQELVASAYRRRKASRIRMMRYQIRRAKDEGA